MRRGISPDARGIRAGGLQGLLSLGERGEFRFPAGLQGAGDQPVLRLDLAEGPLSAVGFVACPLDGQLGGAAGALVLAGDLVGGGQRERDLLGRERVQQHPGDGVVEGRRGDSPAAGRLLPVAAGVALVAGPVAALVVGHHRPAAAAAVDDALAQRAALPDRAGPGGGPVGRQPGLDRQVLLPGHVAGMVVLDQHLPLRAGEPRLDGQVPVPGDVAGMMVLYEDLPLRPGDLGGRGADVPVGVEALAGDVAAVDVGAGVGGVLQHLQHPVVGQRPPPQLPGPRAAVGPLGELAPGERRHDAVGGPGGGEAGEYVSDGGPDLGIGVDRDHAVVVVDEPDGQRGAQLAALGGSQLGRLQPARHDVQLCLAHRGLQAQHEPVVEVRQVVDPVAVDQQRAGQPGHLRQPGQVRVRAGQPGDLQAEHRPDLAQADPRHQVAEPLPVRRRRPRQAQVPVDDLHVPRCPAQPDRSVRQRVLPHRRLGVLADLDHGCPCPVPAGDLVLAVHRRPLSARRTSCRPPPPRPGPALPQ